jgi:hypothetical protein
MARAAWSDTIADMTSTHRSRTPRAAAAAFVAASVAVVAAGFGPASGSAQDTGARTITFLNKDHGAQFIDIAPKGGEDKPPSRGDAFVIYSDLLDPSSKAPLGHGHGTCYVTVPGRKATALCTFALVDGKGTIVVQSVVPFVKSTQPGAVVGGMDAYGGATGTATFKEGKGDFATWTVELTG